MADNDRVDALIEQIDQLDDIDELVNLSLSRGQAATAEAQCPKCYRSWHGKPTYGCPGPFEDGDADLKVPSSPPAIPRARWEELFFAAYCDQCGVQRWYGTAEDRDQWLKQHRRTHPSHSSYFGCCRRSPVNN